MKIKAFTMAEVLIVLTILGVIAALTMPALNANIQKQQAGPALMRAISTLETANALVSQERDFYSFEESCKNYLNDCFEPFVKEKLGAAKLNENIEYTAFGNQDIVQNYPYGYVTKNGFIYYFEDAEFTPIYIKFNIDINGTKRPNMLGKDLFHIFMLVDDENSKIYAYGSTALQDKLEGVSGWRNGNCDATGVRDGNVCGGSIVDNNGRVIYPW